MPKKKLSGRAYLLEQHRQERLLRDREAIRVLREHFTGYDAKAGFSLDVNKIAAMPYHRRRGLRKKYSKIAPILSQPHDLVKAKTKKDAKALRQFTHERMRRMKHFIVQTPTPQSKVRVKDGQVELHTKLPGKAEFTEMYFMFPRRARGHADMLRMFEKMLPGMPKGHYALLTDTYGLTGGIVDRGQLRHELQRLLEAYDRAKYGEHRFMHRIAGFRFMGTTLRGAEVQIKQRDERREAQHNYNRKRREQLAREAKERAKRQK